MAQTQIADLITPEVYLNYMQEDYPERNRLLRSGIVVPPPENVQSQMNAGGTVINMPFWDDLGRGEPDIMSDDPNTSATPDKVTADKDQAVKHFWHKSWSSMDVAGMVATGRAKDPVQQILSRMATWWESAEQGALIASTKGVFADNAANDSDDMTYSIYNDVVSGSITAANRISGAAVRRARVTMGDYMDEFAAIAVHSAVYVNMADNDEIEFIKPSDATEIAMFQGMEVVVDDRMPVTAGTNSPAYTCYLFGRDQKRKERDELIKGLPPIKPVIDKHDGPNEPHSNDIAVLQKQVDDLKADTVDLSGQLSDAQKALEDTNASHLRALGDVQLAHEKTLAHRDESIAGLTTAVEARDEAIETGKTALAVVSDGIEEQAKAHEAELADAAKVIADRDKEISELKSVVAERDTQIEDLTKPKEDA
eukprot:g14900.t1